MGYKIAIVLLNYNNAPDTVHAIESIVACTNSCNHSLIVIDNNSTDGSYKKVENFIASKYRLENINTDSLQEAKLQAMPSIYSQQALDNKGYAAGNNLGIQLALDDKSIDFVWILNNDIELKPDCITQIENFLNNQNNPSIGIYGTLLANYKERKYLQALCGKYYPALAKTVLQLPNYPINQLDEKKIKQEVDGANYFIGASVIFSRNFLDRVGLFNESYFLYAEEIDIFFRGKKMGFKKTIIPNAIVYHKEGSTTSSLPNAITTKKKPFVEYHSSRSKLIFTRLYFSYFLPHIFLLVVANLLWSFRNNLGVAIRIIQYLVSRKKQIVRPSDFK